VFVAVATFAAVVIAFTFFPWLSKGNASTGSIFHRLGAGARELKRDIEGEVNNATEKAKNLELDKLSTQAKDKFNSVVEKAKNLDINKLGESGSESSGDPAAKPNPDGSGPGQSQSSQVRDLLKDVQRGREALKELQKDQ
jgi:hypothetical protein